jgi:hypothetical protein
MNKMRRWLAGSIAGAALFAGAATVPANAQVQQDGIVNVNVGDVTLLEEVNIGVAAQVVANICGVRVGPVAVLATQVDRSGAMRTVCRAERGDISIVQN